MKQAGKTLLLALCGGVLYMMLELLWRGHSHWSMAVLGGVCFALIGGLNEYIPWEMPLWLQGIIGSAIVTALELVSGCILNLWLGLGVWDYSGLPLNLWGQICLPFSLLWVVVSILAVVLDDWLRYWLFDEEHPHYDVF